MQYENLLLKATAAKRLDAELTIQTALVAYRGHRSETVSGTRCRQRHEETFLADDFQDLPIMNHIVQLYTVRLYSTVALAPDLAKRRASNAI